MYYLKRFFLEHLKPHFWPMMVGALLLQLSGLCQALMIGALRYVFEDNLKMSTGQTASASLDFGPLAAIKHTLQSLIPDASSLRDAKFFVPILLVLIFFVRGGFSFMGSMIMVRGGIKATQSLRERLFQHVLRQECSFFQRNPVGEMIQRCVNDVGAVQGIASGQLADAMREITTAIALLCFVMSMDWKLTLTVFVAVPFVIFPLQRLNKTIRTFNHGNVKASSLMLQRLKEVFSNIRVVMCFAREDHEANLFHEQQRMLYRMGMRVARIQSLSSPIMELVGAVLMGTIIIMVSGRIQSGQWKGTDFMTYILGLYAFYDPMRRLTRMNTDLQLVKISLARVYDWLDRKSLIQAPDVPQPVPAKPQALRFENVHFSYDGKHQVLKGVSLEVRRGETVALVGGSGGGKTTLVNLVPRFFDPTEGQLTLDGIDLREFDPRALRQLIGMVTQETLLFMDSVHDNIAYGKEATREAVIEAAKRAHAHEFIEGLSQGYDTLLAETGSSVSGGQRQRLAIARALLQDPPILILDEATSALDTESERAVQAALETLMEDRTTLVIAHRLSTIQRADKICVLKHGKIVEVGKHEELLAHDGEYARLYKIQFGQ